MTPETLPQPLSEHRKAGPGTVVGAAAADALLIMVFAAIGRDAHQRGDIILGVLQTAWPFLAGAALGWLSLRVWRRPLTVRPSGLAVWIGAVAGGMILRAVTGQTVVIAFIVVALLSLGLLLVGYRLILAGVHRMGMARGQR
jgi:peptidoglycan/LPS O-acetylase OafA/YrhL